MLIDSLSAEWTAILTQGNQAFTDGELFATSQGSTSEDVYLYKGGALTKYLAQSTPGLYCSSNHTFLPTPSIQAVSQGVPIRVSSPAPQQTQKGPLPSSY